MEIDKLIGENSQNKKNKLKIRFILEKKSDILFKELSFKLLKKFVT